MQDIKCSVWDALPFGERAVPSSTAPCPSSLHALPGICTWPSQKPVAGLDEPLVWSPLAVLMLLNLPATKVHISQFDNVSCSLDKNTNKPHGARRCVCKVHQCAEATKSKTCCWLTIVCPKIKSRSDRGHKEHTYYLSSILQSFLGERVLVSLRQFTWAEVWQTGTVPTLK